MGQSLQNCSAHKSGITISFQLFDLQLPRLFHHLLIGDEGPLYPYHGSSWRRNIQTDMIPHKMISPSV